jgi:hypothetical protein
MEPRAAVCALNKIGGGTFKSERQHAVILLEPKVIVPVCVKNNRWTHMRGRVVEKNPDRHIQK